MNLKPNRISTFTPITPGQEMAMARQLLEINSERELDRFLPLLAAAVPMLTKIAGPLLKNVAGSLFGGGGGKRKRPRDEQEQFLGKIVKGFFGETELENESESYEQEQFLGSLLGGLFGRRELEAEEEQFLGSIIGKLFGGRELEAENYVQEQFLGGIVKGLLGGELESETVPGGGQARMLRRARRFIRLVNSAAGHAAAEIANMQRAGHRPSPAELRRVVFCALVAAARRFVPRLAALAFPGEGAPQPGPQAAPPQGAPGGQTMLELMIAEATPLGVPSRASRSNGYPLG